MGLGGRVAGCRGGATMPIALSCIDSLFYLCHPKQSVWKVYNTSGAGGREALWCRRRMLDQEDLASEPCMPSNLLGDLGPVMVSQPSQTQRKMKQKRENILNSLEEGRDKNTLTLLSKRIIKLCHRRHWPEGRSGGR